MVGPSGLDFVVRCGLSKEAVKEIAPAVSAVRRTAITWSGALANDLALVAHAIREEADARRGGGEVELAFVLGGPADAGEGEVEVADRLVGELARRACRAWSG